MKNILFPILVLLLATACQNTSTQNGDNAHNILTEAEKEAGWQLLFDGKSTDQWRGYNHDAFPTKGWDIDEEGNLMVFKSDGSEDGFGGDIITKEQYENFELQLDFLVSDTGNSGILYRAIEVEGTPIWHNAPEYQILDNQAYAKEGEESSTHFTAGNYDLHAVPAGLPKPVGEWNTARIVVNGKQVQHYLNGNKTVEYVIESPEWNELVANSKFSEYPSYGRALKGHIALQDHGHLVKFRNIKIKPLPSSLESIFNHEDLSGWEVYGTEKWYVENGELVCESGPDKEYGYLATEESYKDFDLVLEFLQESDGNSGVFFRSSLDGTKISGWQAEVAPPGKHTGGIYESYGRGWLIQPDSTLDSSLKMGEWNSLRVQAIGDRVTTWLNGTHMIELEDEKIGAADGKIALQIHDGGGIKVRWRNIRVMEL